MFKKYVQDIVGKNLYLNDFVYHQLFSKYVNEVENTLKDMKNDDYLIGIDSIKTFRKDIDKYNRVWHTRNVNWDNLHWYGNWRELFGKNFQEESVNTPCVEHGLIFHNNIFFDVRNTARSTCATFSVFRKNIIQKITNIPVFCVGSYIYYADSFYNAESLKKFKEYYGKVLLVFPTHSTEKAELTTNQKLFLENIKKYAKNFDSILINAFWWNINDPLIELLSAEGYKIVTCGFRCDVNFLSRLKAYIMLSDLVMGDSVGTHIGYCLANNIPFSYIPAVTKVKLLDRCENKDIDFVEMHQNKIAEAFLNATEITDKQREIVDYYWGNNLFKTEEEIKAIVEINREITDITYGFTDFRCSAAKKLLKKYADTDEVKYRLLKDAL